MWRQKYTKLVCKMTFTAEALIFIFKYIWHYEGRPKKISHTRTIFNQEFCKKTTLIIRVSDTFVIIYQCNEEKTRKRLKITPLFWNANSL